MKEPAPALPHGSLVEVCAGVHALRGSFRMGPGVAIGRTMTIIEGADGLAIVNPIRVSADTEAELAALGPIKHLVKLSDSHYVDEPYYLDRYGPTFWTLSGANLRGCAPGKNLSGEGPIERGTVIDFGQTAGWREAALLVPHGGGTLVTCDAVQVCGDTEFFSPLGRLVTNLMGFKGGVVVPPMWRRFQKLSGASLRRALAPLVESKFEYLVCGHGPPVKGGAYELVRSAIDRASGRAAAALD